MIHQLSLDTTFILSIWLEVLLYGLYAGLFFASLYVILQNRRFESVPSRVLFGSMLVMFFLATLHIALNLFRLLRAYVWLANEPGGPAAYFGDLARWDHVFKDTIYATQSILGDALAVYRCWLVWDGNYWVIAFPAVMLICSTFSGYIVCWTFTTVHNASIFSPRLNAWITTFFSIALAQNIMTTLLIAYRIWSKDRQAFQIKGRSSLMPIILIFIESAALYMVDELVLVILYAINDNAQYIALETITPIVGITFTSITVRLALQRTVKSSPSYKGATSSQQHSHFSIPMTVRVTRTVDHTEGFGRSPNLFPDDHGSSLDIEQKAAEGSQFFDGK